MNLQNGTKLGPYEIVAPIGAGGMGEVYRARDSRLDRDVALKILPPELSANAQLKLRFEREAKAISGLNHPNICTLYDIGHENGIDYLVLELIEGETLADRISKGGPLPAEQVLRYGAQLADALDRAHRSGVVHRDLKPGNIMITKAGAKLLDFGLAKSVALALADTARTGVSIMPTEQKAITEEGTVIGTFQYMAPEQLEGAEADSRTDIFALGTVLYEMATGRRAFEAKTRTSLIAAIVASHPPPVSRVRPLAPPALDHVIQRCLAKDPDDRWQSARDVSEELKWVAESGSTAGVAAPLAARRKRREWTWIAITTVLALATMFLAAMLFRKETPATRAIRAEISPPADTSLFLFENAAGAVTISPDSRWITFSAIDASGVKKLWLRPIDSLEARPLAQSEDAEYPFWSPDSRSLAFFAKGKLKRMNISGGPATTICDAQEARGGTWAKDGTIIFASHWRGGLSRVSADGGQPVQLTELDPAQGETTHRYPSFLPDGRHYLYLGGSHTADVSSDLNAVYLGSLDSKERKLVVRARSNAVYTAGHILFVRDFFLLAQPFDFEKLEMRGEPRRIGDAVHYESGFFRGAFAAADDGTVVLAPGGTTGASQMTWVDRGGKKLGTLGEPGVLLNIRISPDGKSVAASVNDPADLWIYDVARGVRRRLTTHPFNEYFAVWSPDGKTIVYNSDRDTAVDIYMRTADGHGPEKPLLISKEVKEPTDWSSDGRYLLFDHFLLSGAKQRDIRVLPMDGSRQPFTFLESPFREGSGTFSPDGRWVAFISDESGRPEVYATTFPIPGPRHQISTTGVLVLDGATWIGDEVIYTTPDFHLTSVKVKTAASGNSIDIGVPQPLFKRSPQSTGDVFPDGQKFLITVTEERKETLRLTLVTGWAGTK